MKCSSEGKVPRASFVGPLDSGVVDNPEGIELVLREQIFGIVVLLRFFQSSKQVMSFANGDNGMSRTRGGDISCLFDLVPSDRQWHSNLKNKKMINKLVHNLI